MKGGSKLFLVAGVGLAVVAVAILILGMSGGDKKADANNQQAPVEQVSIIQAAVAVPAHNLLQATDVIEVKVPADQVPADAVTTIGEVLNMSYRMPLATGQTLVKSQLEQPGIRNEIDPGTRAVSVPVDQVSMLSGLIQDGDYVDVVFKTRINLIRLLPTNFAETPEDTATYSYESKGGGDGNGSSGDGGGDSASSLPASASGPILWVAAGFEVDVPMHPYAGDPGSKFVIEDAGGQLEPLAKMMVQDVKVLRVVRPGESYSSDGSLAGQSVTDGATAPTSEDSSGYLILQVSPGQAEALAFMQDSDNQHTYQIIVRGKDDHEKVETTGITFQILASDEEWSMPWPQSLTAPEQDAVVAGDETSGQSGDSIDDLITTPTAEGTPTSDASPTPDGN